MFSMLRNKRNGHLKKDIDFPLYTDIELKKKRNGKTDG